MASVDKDTDGGKCCRARQRGEAQGAPGHGAHGLRLPLERKPPGQRRTLRARTVAECRGNRTRRTGTNEGGQRRGPRAEREPQPAHAQTSHAESSRERQGSGRADRRARSRHLRQTRATRRVDVATLRIATSTRETAQ